jgi:hypothetical protein
MQQFQKISPAFPDGKIVPHARAAAIAIDDQAFARGAAYIADIKFSVTELPVGKEVLTKIGSPFRKSGLYFAACLHFNAPNLSSVIFFSAR